jgi:4a-hydroxytetrahydrobiopterin dehydratase
MTRLVESTCEACRIGAPTLTDAEIAHYRKETPAWDVTEVDGIRRIERTYAFKDFRQALDFTFLVGELAEQEQHHPDIHLAWGKVRVETWTHKIKGLHENDFILAAKTDEVFEKSPHA